MSKETETQPESTAEFQRGVKACMDILVGAGQDATLNDLYDEMDDLIPTPE